MVLTSMVAASQGRQATGRHEHDPRKHRQSFRLADTTLPCYADHTSCASGFTRRANELAATTKFRIGSAPGDQGAGARFLFALREIRGCAVARSKTLLTFTFVLPLGTTRTVGHERKAEAQFAENLGRQRAHDTCAMRPRGQGDST